MSTSAQITCWKLVIPRLDFSERVRLACASKEITALALADLTVGRAELSYLGKGMTYEHRRLACKTRLLALVRFARPGPARLRVSVSSSDLDLDGLVQALEGASQLELISVGGPDTDNGSALAALAEEVFLRPRLRRSEHRALVRRSP
jgi:hypothetical protein